MKKVYLDHLELEPGEIVRSGDTVGYPGLIFSNKGRVWGLSEKGLYEVKLYLNTYKHWRYGYWRFRYDGKTQFVHIPVAKLFVEGYQEGLVVDHIDGNSSNNDASNLRWVTRGVNCKAFWSSLSEDERQELLNKYISGVKEAHQDGKYKEHLEDIHKNHRRGSKRNGNDN